MRKKFIAVLILLGCIYQSNGQQNIINVLDSGRKTSLRGLCVVDDNIIWASGSNGTVARSVDGGKTFEWLTVQGFEQRDFRDVEAFDANTAIIMAVAEPAVILKTKDGGKNWYKVFEDSTKGMFLDAMDFRDRNYGVVVGDPIYQRIFLATTGNGGETWKKSETTSEMEAVFPDGEAFFASSGTNVKFYNGKKPFFYIVSGGSHSNLYVSYIQVNTLPINQGKESKGANSIDINNKLQKGIIVGGDFANDKDTTGNCILFDFKNQFQFYHPQTPPHGYRSCVEYISEKKLITCGTSGVDISNDGGMNWQLISTQSFHVCQKAKKGRAVFLAGANGKIAKLKTP